MFFVFYWMNAFTSIKGGNTLLLKIQGISDAFDGLSNLAKAELKARWEMGNEAEVVIFLLEQLEW